MRKTLTAIALTATIMANAENPFFAPFDTPNGTIPFSKITTADYEPAIDRGIELANKEIDAICNNPEAPTFENTIEALENAGEDLNRVLNVFYPLSSALCDEAMMQIMTNVTPKLSEYGTSIILNEKLWQRVKAVYESKDKLNLNPEQAMLLQNTYDSFALSGANLQGEDRETFRKLSSELSSLTNVFGQNALKELNTYKIWLKAEDLEGLPQSANDAAALAAKEAG
ncbi:MAG: peptidase M3, partial [Muribaculaceae bacterium]